MSRTKQAPADFTDDFVAMANGGPPRARRGLRKVLRGIEGTSAERGRLVQALLMEEMAPYMEGMPPIVQRVMGRVFVECVDWAALASAICADPEDN